MESGSKILVIFLAILVFLALSVTALFIFFFPTTVFWNAAEGVVCGSISKAYEKFLSSGFGGDSLATICGDGGTSVSNNAVIAGGFYCGDGKGIADFVMDYKETIQANGDDPADYIDWIVSAANQELAGDTAVTVPVIINESGFNRYAISPTGAAGLGQFVYGTAKSKMAFSGGKLYDFYNIFGIGKNGKKSLSPDDKKEILDKYKDDARFDAKKSIYATAELWKALSSLGSGGNKNVKQYCSSITDKASFVECTYIYGYNTACVVYGEDSASCKSSRGTAREIKSSYTSIMSKSNDSSSSCQTLIGDNGVPLLKQADSRWASYSYGCDGTTIESSGCGIVSATMVLRYYGADVWPSTLAQYSLDNGYRACGHGTEYAFFPAIAKEYGLRQTSSAVAKPLGEDNWKKIYSALDRGVPVIVSGKGSAPFTTHGHFFVIVGYTENGDKLCVNDPNHSDEKVTACYDAQLLKDNAYFYTIIEK